jgi:hypothetical protein
LPTLRNRDLDRDFRAVGSLDRNERVDHRQRSDLCEEVRRQRCRCCRCGEAGRQLVVSVDLPQYRKGSYAVPLFGDTWTKTGSLPSGDAAVCANEDTNRNGVLETGENVNGAIPYYRRVVQHPLGSWQVRCQRDASACKDPSRWNGGTAVAVREEFRDVGRCQDYGGSVGSVRHGRSRHLSRGADIGGCCFLQECRRHSGLRREPVWAAHRAAPIPTECPL